MALTLRAVSPFDLGRNTSGAAQRTAPPRIEEVVMYDVPSNSGMINDSPKSVSCARPSSVMRMFACTRDQFIATKGDTKTHGVQVSVNHVLRVNWN